eukprot:4783270-Pleurochrysis_carterae.AAC.6
MAYIGQVPHDIGQVYAAFCGEGIGTRSIAPACVAAMTTSACFFILSGSALTLVSVACSCALVASFSVFCVRSDWQAQRESACVREKHTQMYRFIDSQTYRQPDRQANKHAHTHGDTNTIAESKKRLRLHGGLNQ